MNLRLLLSYGMDTDDVVAIVRGSRPMRCGLAVRALSPPSTHSPSTGTSHDRTTGDLIGGNRKRVRSLGGRFLAPKLDQKKGVVAFPISLISQAATWEPRPLSGTSVHAPVPLCVPL